MPRYASEFMRLRGDALARLQSLKAGTSEVGRENEKKQEDQAASLA